jgi:NitT/TauT family transport system substrate-binding protein
MRIKLLVLLMLFSLLLAACAVPAPAAETPATDVLTPVDLGVGFIPSVQFAPFYVGIEKGFFAEEGIELKLAHGFENDYLKLVGVDEVQFMVGSGDQVVLGRGQGLPVRYVMAWYTRYPVVVFAKESAQITAPEHLRGKRIGLPGLFGANYVALRGILAAGGLSEQDVTLESIGFTQAAAISEDQVDAAVDYAVNGPVVLGLAGAATTQIGLDDYLAIPSNGLVTNERTIAEQPDLVAGVVRATLRSIAYTLANPDEAFAIALKFVPEAGGDNEVANRAVFDASLPYWTTPSGRTPGASDLAAWETATQFMLDVGLADQTAPPAEHFTNEFVEQ